MGPSAEFLIAKSIFVILQPVIFEDVLSLHSLNDLSFPGDYLWSQGNETSVVQAPKEFTQTLCEYLKRKRGTSF